MRPFITLGRSIKTFIKDKLIKKEKLLKSIIAIILTVLLLLISGHSGRTFSFSRTEKIVVYILIFLILGIIILIKTNFNKVIDSIKRKKMSPPSTFVIVNIIVILSMILSFIFNDDKINNLYTYISVFLTMGVIWLFISLYSFEEFIKYFSKAMTIISLVSLFFYFITAISRVNFSSGFFYNKTGKTIINSYWGIFFDFDATYTKQNLLPRLMGPFWEPGVLGTYLIFALLCEVYFKEKISIPKFLLFSVCLLLTQSTAAYFLYMILIIYLIYKNIKTDKGKYVFIGAFVSVLLIIVIFYNPIINILAKLWPSIFDKLIGGESLIERLRSPLYNFQLFLQKPLFGYGGKTANEIVATMQYSSTSTYGYVLAAFGIIGFVYILLPIIGVLQSKRITGIFEKILFVVIVIAIFNKENQIEQFVPNLFMAYFIVDMPKRFRKIDEFDSDSALHLKDILVSQSKGGVLVKDLGSSAIVRVLSLVTGFLLTPILNRFFGVDESYGVWLVLVSIVSWILTFDFGLGNGLKNKLIAARKENNREEEKKYISSTYASTALVSVIALLVGTIVIFTIDLNKVMDISTSVVELSTLRLTSFFLLLAICLELVLKNIIFILQSYSKNAIGSSLLMFSNILLVVFALTYNGKMDNSRFIILGIVYVIAINLPLLIANFFVFRKKNADIRPSLKHVSFSKAKMVLTLSIMFFVVQIGNMLMSSTNQLFVSHSFGQVAVVDYEKYNKMFSFLLSVYGGIIQPPIWIAVTKAFVNKDTQYIKKMQRLSIIFSVLFIILTIIMGVGLQFIFDIWLGSNTIVVEWKVVLAFIVYNVLYLVAGAFIIICNGLSALKTQGVSLLVGVVLKIPITLLINKIFPNLGWSSIIVYNSLVFLPMILLMPLEIKKTISKIPLIEVVEVE